LIGVSVFNYFTSLAIFKNFLKSKKSILFLSVVVNISVLLLFKYYEFFRFSFESVFSKMGFAVSLPLIEILLPIGLSFYIFRTISYNADVYFGKISLMPKFLDVLLYIAFFPQLLAGPIMRAPEFLIQLENGGVKKIENLWENLSLIILGLFKKLVISSYLALNITNNVFAVPENHSSLVLLLAVFAYSLVIYFDFSSYSDMAIGFAGLLGFKSPVNFDGPYLVLNLKDFWRKWHITLSSWFRDYVYIPLGGSKAGKIRKYLNLIIVMVLAGLWHGAALTFIIWGFLHGIGLALTHIYQDYKTKITIKAGIIKNFICWLVTFVFVSFTWIFFASPSIESALSFIKLIFVPQVTADPVSIYIILVMLMGFVFFVFEKIIFAKLVSIQEKLPVFVSFLFVIIVFILIFELSPDTVPPFIYFSF